MRRRRTVGGVLVGPCRPLSQNVNRIASWIRRVPLVASRMDPNTIGALALTPVHCSVPNGQVSSELREAKQRLGREKE